MVVLVYANVMDRRDGYLVSIALLSDLLLDCDFFDFVRRSEKLLARLVRRCVSAREGRLLELSAVVELPASDNVLDRREYATILCSCG